MEIIIYQAGSIQTPKTTVAKFICPLASIFTCLRANFSCPGLHLFFPSRKVFAHKTSDTLCSPNDLPWAGYEDVQLMLISVLTVLFLVVYLFIYVFILQVIHCTASVIHLAIAEALFCQLPLIHGCLLHGSFTTLLVELEQELSFQPLSEILWVP